jgi:hypothetical protein
MSMNHLLSWGLALAALVAGYVGWGWPGLVLAVTVLVFWLLLQFSRALRVMRLAAGRPKGSVDSAVMLQARLQKGMRLAQVMRLTGSFGLVHSPEADGKESFQWADTSGSTVTVHLDQGRVSTWTLKRSA